MLKIVKVMDLSNLEEQEILARQQIFAGPGDVGRMAFWSEYQIYTVTIRVGN